MKLRALIVLAVIAILAVPAAAHAAGWKRITAASGGTSIDQVGLLRSGDGVLHVAWHIRTGPNSEDIRHTTIAGNGAVGATTVVAGSWAGLENPALVAMPDGLRAFFGGIRTTVAGEPNQELNAALSTDGGATWTLQIGSIVPLGAQPYGSPVSAATLPSGVALQTWAGTLGTWVHAGLDPASPNYDYQGPLGNYGYDAGIAADATGTAIAAWYSNATGHLGVHAQAVAGNGAPIGSAVQMPNTANMASGMIGRTPIVARAGGGFYVAYPTGYPTSNRIRLWRVGSSSARLIARTTGNSAASVAADPNGRLWVIWKDTSGFRPVIWASRSNRAATSFGAPVLAGRPTAGSSLYQVDGSATASALDVFGSFSLGTSSTVSTYYRRVLPGLIVSSSRSRITRGVPTSVTFRVSDAGDPVAGARVRVGAKSGTTNSQGRVTLTLTRSSSISAVASKSGYTSDSVRVRVSS